MILPVPTESNTARLPRPVTAEFGTVLPTLRFPVIFKVLPSHDNPLLPFLRESLEEPASTPKNIPSALNTPVGDCPIERYGSSLPPARVILAVSPTAFNPMFNVFFINDSSKIAILAATKKSS